MYVLWIVLAFNVIFAINAEEPHFCCEGVYVPQNKTCNNGKPITLNCTKKFMLSTAPGFDEVFEIDKLGRLLYSLPGSTNQVTIKKSEYCLTKIDTDNASHVAMVCDEAVDVPSDEPVDVPIPKWYSLRVILGFLSVLFIVATLTVYYLVPNLRDLQGKCIIHALTALAISLLYLVILQLALLSDHMCWFFALSTYLCFMTTFFWLNVTSFHVWKTVVRPDMLGTDKQWYTIYNIYGHGMPVIFLIIVLIAQSVEGDHVKPGIGEVSCWFGSTLATWAYFYGPISVLLCINLILFISCSSKLYSESRVTSELKLKSLKYKVRLYVQLFMVMGLVWFFEVISAALNNVHVVLDYIWVITDYINLLQGVFIFLLLVVLRKRALRGLANTGCCCYQFPSAWKTFEDGETILEDECESQLSNNN